MKSHTLALGVIEKTGTQMKTRRQEATYLSSKLAPFLTKKSPAGESVCLVPDFMPEIFQV